MILTLCKAVDGKTYQKTDYSALPLPYTNDLLNVEISDLNSLYDIYGKILSMPVITQVIGRSREAEKKNTVRQKYNFYEAPVDYLILDLDKYEPDNSFIRRSVDAEGLITDQIIVNDIEQFITQWLPPEFQQVSYIYRLSSSFYKANDPRLRLHLIFCLEEAAYPQDLGLWMKATEMPVDSSVYFNWSRPIFSAAPAFVRTVDPIAHMNLRRLNMIEKDLESVPGWKPLEVDTPKAREQRQAGIGEVLPSSDLPGEIGAFNRTYTVESVLSDCGYVDMGDGRWIAPGSQTGAPGVVVFANGYCFSHHDGDLLDQIKTDVYGGKKNALHAYSIAAGLARIQGNEEQGAFREKVRTACANDTIYNDEEQKLLYSCLEWIDPDKGFEGINKQVIDNLMSSLINSYINPLMVKEIFTRVKKQSGNKIGVGILEDYYKKLLRQSGNLVGSVNMEAEPRNNAEIMVHRHEVVAEGGNPKGGFYVYLDTLGLWIYGDRDTAKAHLENKFTDCVPDNCYFKPAIMEQQIKYTLNIASTNGSGFVPGPVWSFREGLTGVSMDQWENPYIDWKPDTVVKTLSKEDYAVNRLNISNDQWIRASHIKPEKFFRFMQTTFEDDWERINIMQEWMGYLFDFSYAHQKFLYMEGLPGSGKSVISKIMEACVTPQYTLSTTLNRIATDFGLEQLPGKSLMILSEARFADYAEKSAYNEILLRITGTDKFDINRKHMKSVQIQSPAKVVIMSNQTPILSDETGALLQRMMLMKFHKTFRNTEQEVFNIERDIIREELPAVIRWSLEGLYRLREQGRFSESVVNKRSQVEIDQAVSPLRAFMEHYCTYNPLSEKENWITTTQFKTMFRAFNYRVRNHRLTTIEADKASTIVKIQSINPHIEKARQRIGGEPTWLLKPLTFIRSLQEMQLEFQLETQDLESDQK